MNPAFIKLAGNLLGFAGTAIMGTVVEKYVSKATRHTLAKFTSSERMIVIPKENGGKAIIFDINENK